MARVDKSIEVVAPLSTVYNQWTQFEEFPRFMEGVKAVRQLDDTHLHWCATVSGKEIEWDAEIVEQRTDRSIAWRSTTGAKNAGTVQFEPLGELRTRVSVTIEYDPEGLVENLGDVLGVTAYRIEGDLDRFKKFIEARDTETGEWRGEVRGGQQVPAGRGANVNPAKRRGAPTGQ